MKLKKISFISLLLGMKINLSCDIYPCIHGTLSIHPSLQLISDKWMFIYRHFCTSVFKWYSCKTVKSFNSLFSWKYKMYSLFKILFTCLSWVKVLENCSIPISIFCFLNHLVFISYIDVVILVFAAKQCLFYKSNYLGIF